MFRHKRYEARLRGLFAKVYVADRERRVCLASCACSGWSCDKHGLQECRACDGAAPPAVIPARGCRARNPGFFRAAAAAPPEARSSSVAFLTMRRMRFITQTHLVVPGGSARERPGFFARQPRARMTNAAGSHVNLFAGRDTSGCSGRNAARHAHELFTNVYLARS